MNPLGAALMEASQMAYVTRDLTWASNRLSKLLGLGPFSARETALTLVDADFVPRGDFRLKVAMAFHRDRNVELIEQVDDCPALFAGYESQLEAHGVAFHHVGVQRTADSLGPFLHAVGEAGLEAVNFLRSSGGDVTFIDCRHALGHWVEILRMEPAPE